MPKFMLVFRGGAVVNQNLSVAERKAQVGKWTAWMDSLKSSGNFLPGGAPLRVEGLLVRSTRRELAAGFPADSELVTGTYFLDASSLTAAGELAKGCPILDLDGSVEVRAVLERPQGGPHPERQRDA